MTDYLSKKDSTIIRTIAIIMMIYCHFFGKENGGTYFENAFWNIYIFNHSLQGTIAFFCKLCTSIFAFISGYGLYYSFNKSGKSTKNKIKYVLNKFLKLYIVYLLSLAIYVVAYRCYHKPLTGMDVIYNLFLTHRIIGPSWYIVFYYEAVTLLLIMNITKENTSFKDGHFLNNERGVIEFVLAAIVPAFLNYCFPNRRFFHFISVFLYGYLMKKHNVYEKACIIRKYRIYSFFLLAILFILRIILGDEVLGFTMITFVTPVFIFVLKDMLQYFPNAFIAALLKISKYTTYHWLLQLHFPMWHCRITESSFYPIFKQFDYHMDDFNINSYFVYFKFCSK